MEGMQTNGLVGPIVHKHVSLPLPPLCSKELVEQSGWWWGDSVVLVLEGGLPKPGGLPSPLPCPGSDTTMDSHHCL